MKLSQRECLFGVFIAISSGVHAADTQNVPEINLIRLEDYTGNAQATGVGWYPHEMAVAVTFNDNRVIRWNPENLRKEYCGAEANQLQLYRAPGENPVCSSYRLNLINGRVVVSYKDQSGQWIPYVRYVGNTQPIQFISWGQFGSRFIAVSADGREAFLGSFVPRLDSLCAEKLKSSLQKLLNEQDRSDEGEKGRCCSVS